MATFKLDMVALWITFRPPSGIGMCVVVLGHINDRRFCPLCDDVLDFFVPYYLHHVVVEYCRGGQYIPAPVFFVLVVVVVPVVVVKITTVAIVVVMARRGQRQHQIKIIRFG